MWRLASLGMAVLAGSVAIWPFVGVWAAELRLTPFGGLSLAATSNVFLDSTGRKADFSSQTEPGRQAPT